jgi:hypothetical protein
MVQRSGRINPVYLRDVEILGRNDWNSQRMVQTMRIKTLERIKFAMGGRSVPVIKVDDIDENGKIKTINFLGEIKKRPNSLVVTWDEKGYEIDKSAGLINLIDEKGIRQPAYIVSVQGKTVDLFTQPYKGKNFEDVIGRGAMCDDISDNMDLGKSMRNLLIGGVIGAGVGMFILGPLLTKMMS